MGIDIREISFQTLTPLWSGGAYGKCEAGDLLETSIIGSLRWWLEAIARGHGLPVPDPTAPREDAEESPPSCVDRVFGHTGRKRLFRLEIVQSSVRTERVEKQVELEDVDRDGWSTWYFPGGKAFLGNPGPNRQPTISARLISTPVSVDKTEPSFSIDCIQGLLSFIARWGALGAKTQHGFGAIDYHSPTGVIALRDWLDAERKLVANAPNAAADLPSISRFFSFTLPIKDPCDLGNNQQRQKRAIEMRQFLRSRFRRQETHDEQALRHRIMGFVEEGADKRHGSRVFISLPYRSEAGQAMRIWGWDSEVDLVVNRISELFSEHGRELPKDSSFSWTDPDFGTVAYAQRLLTEVSK